MKSSDILNLYYIAYFYATHILEIVIRSKLIYGSLIRYAGIHIIENMVYHYVSTSKQTTVSALLTATALCK